MIKGLAGAFAVVVVGIGIVMLVGAVSTENPDISTLVTAVVGAGAVTGSLLFYLAVHVEDAARDMKDLSEKLDDIVKATKYTAMQSRKNKDS